MDRSGHPQAGNATGILSALQEPATFGARLARQRSWWTALFIAAFTAFYFYVTCYRAVRKLFWYDELFTFYVSSLPSLQSIWHALTHGVDFNPPLVYLLTQLSEKVLGVGHLGSRMPEIVAFWIFCLCLFRFVSLRAGVVSGFIAMAFPLVTTAYYYAYEARPHGLVLCCCGMALVSWQGAASSQGRRFGWLLALGASLACGLLLHNFAVLLFVPIALGELTRLVVRKRSDWPLWITVCIAACFLGVCLIQWHATRSYLGNVFPAKLESLIYCYPYFYGPALNVIVIAVSLLAIGRSLFRQTAKEEGAPQATVEAHEWVAVLALVLIPFFAFLLSRLGKAPMTPRYSIATVAGLACIVGLSFAKRPVIASIVLVAIAAQAGMDFREFRRNSGVGEPSSSTWIPATFSPYGSEFDALRSSPHHDLPIVLLDWLEFAPMFHYAPPDLSPRLVFLSASDKFISENYRLLQECCQAPGRVSSLAALLTTNRSFLAYSTDRYLSVLDTFLKDGARVTAEKAWPGHSLFLIDYSGAPGSR